MQPGAQTNKKAAAANSFYHLDQIDLSGRACQGLACFSARGDAPERWRQALHDTPPVFCYGQCFCGPACGGENNRPTITAAAPTSVLLNNIRAGGVRDLRQYQQHGGGRALHLVLQKNPAQIIAMITASGLRGRGGAGFPTGRKWQLVADAIAARKYVVANADEGDPGAFSDRILIEDDPFLLIEAMIIAGIIVGAQCGYIYLRKEYQQAEIILRAALQQAHASRWLGENILDSSHRFELELVVGAGSYVCGEETALLNSIEGKRAEVRVRPPQITDRGLYGAPTLMNNVETLCAVPWIIANGGDAYAQLGTAHSRGTKLLSLNSLFNKPGLYEVEFGISVRDIVEQLGDGLRRGRLKGVMIGGPLAGLIPAHCLDTPLCYEALHDIGCAVGHGGVIAFADDTSIAAIIAEVFRFGAFESCGKCTPCHLGSPEVTQQFARATRGEKIDAARWRDLIDVLAATSLCGHGRGLAEFARAIERHYPEELATCFV